MHFKNWRSSKLRAKARAENRHRTAVAIESWVDGELAVRRESPGAEGEAVPAFHSLLVSPMRQPAVASQDAEIAALTASRRSFVVNCPAMKCPDVILS